MVGVIVVFILLWVWIAHEIKHAPLIDDDTYMERDKQWYIDQYNRNRSHKDQIQTWEQFKQKTKPYGKQTL
jgi:hypothetical protein|tara:strand:+ start:3931 stop:4143 length:213 start_codon:yes stop_codon:yes gene_type:complete